MLDDPGKVEGLGDFAGDEFSIQAIDGLSTISHDRRYGTFPASSTNSSRDDESRKHERAKTRNDRERQFSAEGLRHTKPAPES
jgi:hypothetical protein